VNAIQANYKLTPLTQWGKPYTPPTNVPVDKTVDLSKIPPDQVEAMDAGTFFNRLAMLMKDNPPAAEDAEALRKLKDIGVEPGKLFDISKVSPAIAHGLERAMKEAPVKLQQGILKMKTVNGWMQPNDIGHYGKDYDTRAGGLAPTSRRTPSIPRASTMETATRSTAPTSTSCTTTRGRSSLQTLPGPSRNTRGTSTKSMP
jgi:hypothetical protein